MGEEQQPGDRHADWLPPQAPGTEHAPAPPIASPPPSQAPAPSPPTAGAPPSSSSPYPLPPAPPPAAGPSQAPLGAPYPLPPAPPRPPGNDRAVLSLILGICGLVAFLSAQFGLFFVFNLPPAIAAWVVGAHARRRVERGETTEHARTAQVGMVLGIVGTVLGVLAIVAWALALALSDDVRRWIIDLNT